MSDMNGTASANGVHEPQTRAEAEAALTGEPLTLGYRPSMITSMGLDYDSGGRFPGTQALYDIEQMLGHPDVLMPYLVYQAGIADCKFTVKAATEEQARFVHAFYMHLWETYLEILQHTWDYGWCGYEISYKDKKGYLHFDGISEIHPFDAWCLVDRKRRYRGVSVQGTTAQGPNRLALWGPGHWPAKGLWLTHHRRFNRYYGRSQLFGGWRPWRRLATRDGAEEIIDGGIYRFAYRGPIGRFPIDAFKRSDGTVDYDAAREKMRQFVEQAKAGASIALPGNRDDKGEYKWSIDWPNHVLDVAPLLSYEENLQKQISRGIGVPPELFQASDVGSGWSGRKIPLIGFYTSQLRNARGLVRQTKEQLADPMLKWNYGREAWCEVGTEIELPEALRGDMGQQPGQAMQQQATGGQGGGLIPYQGPRGGQGYKDPRSGRVQYGLSCLSDDDRPGVTVATDERGQVVVLERYRSHELGYVEDDPPGEEIDNRALVLSLTDALEQAGKVAAVEEQEEQTRGWDDYRERMGPNRWSPLAIGLSLAAEDVPVIDLSDVVDDEGVAC